MTHPSALKLVPVVLVVLIAALACDRGRDHPGSFGNSTAT